MTLNLIIELAEPSHRQVERFLRQQIQTGELQPSQQLPSTAELTRKWKVSPETIRKAMTHLIADGLMIRTHHGTFVKSKAARMLIGILVSAPLTDETAYFYRAMVRFLTTAIDENKERQWEGRVYDALTKAKAAPKLVESPVYRNLAVDVRNGFLEGIIELGTSVDGLPALEKAKLPRVRWGEDVYVDMQAFGEQCVKLAVSRGIREIIYLRTFEEGPDLKALNDTARSLKLPPPIVRQMTRTWVGGVEYEQAVYENTLHLLDHWNTGSHQPKALIIPDDIGARAATVAVVKKGIPVPQRLMVIAMTNEGIDLHYPVPIIRYIHPVKKIAEGLIEMLHHKMKGISDGQELKPVKLAGYFQTDSVTTGHRPKRVELADHALVGQGSKG